MPDGEPLTLRDVPGIAVGHATDLEGLTGCTVVLTADGAVAGVDVRGPAPGTRETDLLRPTALVERIDAVCLAGGSAFGLRTADGVMDWLAARGRGFPTGVRPVPIVPAAIIFDFEVGSAEAIPGPDAGASACDAAAAGDGPVEGAVGAGTGATVGKLAGARRASPGGVGSAAIRQGDATIGALAINNALGNVLGRDGRILAGARADDGGYLDAGVLLAQELAETDPPPPAGANTVLMVVATDAALDRSACRRLAALAHDGLALAVSPAHTLLDGDVAFALSTGRAPGPGDLPARLRLEAAVVEVVRTAIERSVTSRGRGPG